MKFVGQTWRRRHIWELWNNDMWWQSKVGIMKGVPVLWDKFLVKLDGLDLPKLQEMILEEDRLLVISLQRATNCMNPPPIGSYFMILMSSNRWSNAVWFLWMHSLRWCFMHRQTRGEGQNSRPRYTLRNLNVLAMFAPYKIAPCFSLNFWLKSKLICNPFLL